MNTYIAPGTPEERELVGKKGRVAKLADTAFKRNFLTRPQFMRLMYSLPTMQLSKAQEWLDWFYKKGVDNGA